MDAAESNARLELAPRMVAAYIRAKWRKRILAGVAVPGIALAAVYGYGLARRTTYGLALALGLAAPVSLLAVTLLAPFLLLRPRPYEDMPRSAFAAMLVAPMVLIVGHAVALLQTNRELYGPATCAAWASNLCNVLCLAWAIFRDSYYTTQ